MSLTLTLKFFRAQSMLFVFTIHSSETSKLLLNLNIQICYILSTLFGEIPLGIACALRHRPNCRIIFRTQFHVKRAGVRWNRDGILFSFVFDICRVCKDFKFENILALIQLIHFLEAEKNNKSYYNWHSNRIKNLRLEIRVLLSIKYASHKLRGLLKKVSA